MLVSATRARLKSAGGFFINSQLSAVPCQLIIERKLRTQFILNNWQRTADN